MKKLILVVVALFIFGCATSNEENHAGAYYSQGVDWENKGDYERAIANYSKAIEIDPKLAEAYFGRGVHTSTKASMTMPSLTAARP
jgi:tetratricopeptide (TPR) repeat protein